MTVMLTMQWMVKQEIRVVPIQTELYAYIIHIPVY